MNNNISRDKAVAALEDERLYDPVPGSNGDIAYNEAIHDCIRAIRALTSAPAPQPWTKEQLAEAMREAWSTDLGNGESPAVIWKVMARVALSRPLAKVDVEDVRLVAEYRMPGTDAVFDIDDVTAAAYRILAAIWEGKP